jgi:hypothetical protein
MIHYSSSLKLTIMKSQGQGDCGKAGYISGYRGLVSCKACVQIMEQEAAQSQILKAQMGAML